MTKLWNLIQAYPVRAQGIVVAAIATGTAFGLGWDGVQVGAVTGLSAAILMFLTEKVVTPTAAPQLPNGTSVTTPEGGNAMVTPA
jgi:hypothetical protein